MKTPEDRLHRFEEIVEAVCKVETVLVEGKGDKEALRNLGVETEVIRVKGNGKSLLTNAEEVSRKTEEAIVLTDWDSQGEKLCSKLKKLLELHGVFPRTEERNQLRGLTQKEVHEVEALTSWKKRIKKEIKKQKNPRKNRQNRYRQKIENIEQENKEKEEDSDIIEEISIPEFWGQV